MTNRDRGGPMVGVCAGTRCTALWRLASQQRSGPGEDHTGSPPAQPDGREDFWSIQGPAAIRAATGRCPGGILLRLECPGCCARGAVVLLSVRSAETGASGCTTLLACVDEGSRTASLLGWISSSRGGGFEELPSPRLTDQESSAPPGAPPH